MRVLIAMMNRAQADSIQAFLYREDITWNITVVTDGVAATKELLNEQFDLLALHACLPVMDGYSVLTELWTQRQICPPRILYLSQPGLNSRYQIKPDCVAPISAAPQQIASLLLTLAKKPLPMLAAATKDEVEDMVDLFLDALCIRTDLKGRKYAAWMLVRLVQSSVAEHEPIASLYASCAKAYRTSGAAVERCLRIAVENVFTQGSMKGIEQYFGATVDPERGKPTNRAFLMQAMHQIRICLTAHSLPSDLSPNRSEIHHNPAAPTTV